MKKYLIVMALISVMFVAKSQDTKKIGAIHATVNNQNPKNFQLDDEFVKITPNSLGGQKLSVNIENKTDKTISLIWEDSYFVLSNETTPASNSAYEVLKLSDQKIAPGAKIVADFWSNKYIFDLFGAESLYRKSGETLVNKVVIAILVNGVKKEYPLSIELYTKKNLKDRKLK